MRIRNNTLASIMLCCSIFIISSPANAVVTLSLEPTLQSAFIGDDIDIFLNVSGLNSGAPPSLAAFDIDLTFITPQLAFQSVDFGSSLGIPDTNFAGGVSNSTETEISVLEAADFINLTETSLLGGSSLDMLQGTSFTLATITFTAMQAGSALVSGDLFLLEDAFGNGLIDTFGPVDSAWIDITSVPEPSTILLFAIGFFVAYSLIKKRIIKARRIK